MMSFWSKKRTFKWIKAFCILLLLYEGSLQSIPLQKINSWDPLLRNISAPAKEFQWWFCPLLLFLIETLELAIRKAEDSYKQRIIKLVINKYRDDIFGKNKPAHEYRVTLFKHKRTVWGFRKGLKGCKGGGWLVPFSRSGHTTLDTKTIFKAPLNNPQNAEGFAGYVWQSKGERSLAYLPNPKNDQSLIHQYSNETRISEEWVQERIDTNKTIPLSFHGFAIEVENEIWGVLVIDSCDPEKPKTNQKVDSLLSYVVGKLLEGEKNG